MTPEVQWESTELNIYQSEREVEKKKNQSVTWGDSLQNKHYAKHFQKNKTEILKDTLNSLFRKRKKCFGAEN